MRRSGEPWRRRSSTRSPSTAACSPSATRTSHPISRRTLRSTPSPKQRTSTRTSLRAINARTEILNGADECSVQGAGGLLAQNWDWHPDLSASTVVWIVEHRDGWFATLTEAGILAKIGLNQAGLGVCLNILRTTADGGTDGTPIHLLLRQLLEQTTTVDEAIAHLTSAKVTASSAVTVATPGDVAHVELNPGGANVIRGPVGAHTNHFIEPPKAGTDVMATESPTTHQRLEIVRQQPLLDALRDHTGHPKGVCRHVDEQRPVGRADRHGRVSRDEPGEAPLARGRRPALHPRARRDHTADACFFRSARIDSSAVTASVATITASDSQIGTCQTSTSSIFAPMNARMNARPCVR